MADVNSQPHRPVSREGLPIFIEQLHGKQRSPGEQKTYSTQRKRKQVALGKGKYLSSGKEQ